MQRRLHSYFWIAKMFLVGGCSYNIYQQGATTDPLEAQAPSCGYLNGANAFFQSVWSCIHPERCSTQLMFVQMLYFHGSLRLNTHRPALNTVFTVPDIYTSTQTHFTACTQTAKNQFRWGTFTAGARWDFKCLWCGKTRRMRKRASNDMSQRESSRNGFCKALAVGINAGFRVKGVFRGKRTNTWWRFTEELFRRVSNAPLNSTSALQPRLTQPHPQHCRLKPEVSFRNPRVTAIDFWVEIVL